MSENELIARVRELDPELRIEKSEVKAEGQSNDVVIINDQWVFRFAKSEAAAKDLDREARILTLVRQYVDLPVPDLTMLEPTVMRQRKVDGQPIDRHTLLRQSNDVQERLVEEMAHLLFQLHRVPEDKLRGAGVGKSNAGEGLSDAVRLFHDCERELFPHLKDYAIAVVREHFEPVLDGTLSLDYSPVLIHGDLNPSHLLWDPERGKLVGVIDFGMAGFGDSALDYAHMIMAYGETPLHRMNQHHKSIGEKIDRARFWALTIELKLTLSGLRSGDPRWFCSHIGTARDTRPIGSPWN